MWSFLNCTVYRLLLVCMHGRDEKCIQHCNQKLLRGKCVEEMYLMWSFLNWAIYRILSVTMHGRDEKYIQNFNQKD